MGRIINLFGQRIGTFRVLRRSPRSARPSGGRIYWWVRCVRCGMKYEIRTDNLRRRAVTCKCQGPTCLKPRQVEPGEIGARYQDSAGYIRLYAPWHSQATAQGWILEHRHKMEIYLGRVLTPNEVVHHRDGNRANNDRGNLDLFDSLESHAAEHKKLDALNGAVPVDETF